MRDQHTDVQDLYQIRASMNAVRIVICDAYATVSNFQVAMQRCNEALTLIDTAIEVQKDTRDRRAEYKRQIKRVISGLRYWYKPNSSAHEVADSVDELVDKIETGTE